MSDETLELKIDADVSGAKQEVAALKEELKATKEEVKELNASNKALNESNENLAKSVLDIAQNYTGMGGQIRRVRGLIGKLVPTFKNLFKTIKLGVASTGIGLLVIALGSVVTAMATTTKGGKAVKAIMNGIGEVVNFLLTPLKAAGDALLSLFGVDDTTAIDSAEILASELAAIDKTLGDIQLKRSKDNVQLDANRRIIDDTTKSEKVRLAALEDSYNINKKNNEDELAALQETLKAQEAHLTQKEKDLKWEQKREKDHGRSGKRKEEEQAVNKALKDRQATLKKISDLQGQIVINERNYADDITGITGNKVQEFLEKAFAKAKERHEQQKKWQEERKAGEIAVNAVIDKLTDELAVSALKTEEEKELKKLEIQKRNELASINSSKASKATKDAAILLLDAKFKEQEAAITKKYDDIDQEKKDKEAEDLKKIREENLLEEIEDENKRQLKLLELQKISELEQIAEHENFAELKLEIDKKYKRLEAEVDEKAKEDQKERDQDLHDAKMGMAMDGMNLIQEIANFEADQAVAKDKEIERSQTRGAKIAKAVALAQAAITGTEGVMNTFTSAGKSPLASIIPGYQFIQAGLAAGFAAQNIRKIAAGEPPSDTGGTSGVDTTPAPAMMGGAFTLGEAAAPEPVRAFVVTDEMTSSQNQLANIRRRATI
jgi:hypothetical protein